MTLRQRFNRAARRLRRHRSNANLRSYLRAKARLGLWDRRYCAYSGCSTRVTPWVRRFITRAYAAGLVPTFTIEGQHSAGSYHTPNFVYRGRKVGRAADVGLRREEVGTAKGRRRMERFQRAEFARRNRSRATELIGPLNGLIILRGRPTSLPEGDPLEQMHDNHVHGARSTP